MTVLHSGTNKNYSTNWDKAFRKTKSTGAGEKRSAGKSAVAAKPAPAVKAEVVKKAAKKAPAKKTGKTRRS